MDICVLQRQICFRQSTSESEVVGNNEPPAPPFHDISNSLSINELLPSPMKKINPAVRNLLVQLFNFDHCGELSGLVES